MAQLFNPHSFLTRHVRWNYWPTLPWELKELIVLYQLACTYLLVAFGTLTAFARGRGPWSLVAAGTIAYHVGIIGVLYGITRFRLPLEPLWMLYIAAWLGSTDAPIRQLRQRPLALAGAVILTSPLLAAMTRYAWTGFPGLGG
jgi:hypothetical protein